MNKDNMKEYEEYFKPLIDALDEEFVKSQEYSVIIDAEIKKFNGLTNSKGGQHYLIEHVKNAVTLQSQRQSIYKDKFNIMKSILDFTFKDGDEGSEENLFSELKKLAAKTEKIIKDNEKTNDKVAQSVENEKLDAEIDKALGDFSEEEDE